MVTEARSGFVGESGRRGDLIAFVAACWIAGIVLTFGRPGFMLMLAPLVLLSFGYVIVHAITMAIQLYQRLQGRT